MMKKKWMKLLAPLTAMAMAGMALTGCSGGNNGCRRRGYVCGIFLRRRRRCGGSSHW